MRHLQSSVKTRPNQAKTAPVGRELAVIDGALQDWQQLAQGVRPGVETAILDPSRDGIVQVTEILSRSVANGGYTALHIVGHAEPGSLQLGTARLNRETLSRYAWDLQFWQKLLLPTREKGKSDLFPMPNAQCPMPHSLLIYGCSFAAGETGQNFLRVLSEITGANIAASSSPVGSAAKGGNWELDTAIGEISTALAFSPELQQTYAGVFATLNVNSFADNLTGGDGMVTLREAIIAANTDTATDLGETGSGADTIILPAGTYTLALTGTGEDAAATGDLDITSDVTIQGASAATTTIDANSIDRVLHVLSGGSLTLENATITGGSSSEGGGINNNSTVTVTNSTISGNSSSFGGGGIYNNSTVTVTNSTISGNSCSEGEGGGIFNNSTVTVTNSTISGNSSSIGGGGILNNSTVTVTNSTVSSNSSQGTGGGIFNNSLRTATANNSIISGNTATTNPDVSGTFTGSNNIIGNIGSATGFTSTIPAAATATINTTLANNGGPTQTHALVVGGPAIDAGDNAAAAALTTDQRGTGFARIFNTTVDIGAYEAQPEIDIQGGSGSTSIASGDTTPATTDDTDFGSVNIVGATETHAFTILNIQPGALLDLNPTGVTITGDPDFTVTGDPTSPVAPGNSTSFEITFDPSATGVRTATVSIANNDPDENPYTFAVQGNGLATPEIDIQGFGSTSIPDGDTTPATADGTDFGSVDIADGIAAFNIFTIANTGTGSLTLSGTPLVNITGANAGDFTVEMVPTSPVAAAGTTTFGITFDPSAAGTRTAIISIANNDSDENPYTFSVRGTGTATPEIQVLDGSTDIADSTTTVQDFGSTTVGGTLSKTFTINNTGSAALNLSGLTLPTGFTSTLPTSVAAGANATFTVNADTSAVASLSGTLQFTTNDSDENPFNFPISAAIAADPAPEIQVLDGSSKIADGTTTALDFGNATVGGTLSNSFTINNLGTATLNLSSLSLPTGFTGTLPTSVAAGGSETFTVNVDTSAVASLSGTLQFTTNDADENPFNFPISAAIAADPAPEIQVLDGSTDIADGTTTALDFGNATVGGTLSNTFTINNLGSATLNLSSLSLPTGFTGTLPTSVAAGSSETFTVNVDTSAVASLSGTLQFTTDDSNENPFDFPISAAIAADPAPEIQVLDGSTDIADGTTTTLDFGNTTVGGTLSNSFTINNLGSAALNLSNLSLPTGFTGTLPTSVAAGSSATFTVNADTSAVASLSGTLQFTTNDSDENPFNFPISAAIAADPAPEIQVLDGSTDIADGTTTALDFGNTTVGGTLSNTFTINNLGSADLNLSSLSLPTGFSGTLPTTVAAGGSGTFTVNVDTATAGTLSGTLQFVTDDADESPFDFPISVEVTSEPEIQVLDGSTNIADGTTTALDFGKTTTGGTLSNTFTINNLGSAALNLSSLSLPTGFTGTLPTTVAAGGSETFTVNVDTSAVTSYSGTLQFVTDDSNENPFDFAISAEITATPEPEVQVLDGSTGIADGTTTALDFGNTTVGGTLNKTFTINNLGSAALNLSSLSLPTGFTGTLPTTVAAGGSQTFTVNVDTATAGTLSGTLQFVTDDSNENPFDFPISATVNIGPAGPVVISDDNLEVPTTALGTGSGDTASGDTTGGGTGDIIDCTCPPIPELPLVSFDPGEPNPARGGDDTLIGNNGNNLLAGSTGNDWIAGLGGSDILIGGNGSLNSDSGKDSDILFGNGGEDSLQGSEGNDTIYSGKDNDIARGGKDDDLIYGDIGNDTLSGDRGNDQLFGGTSDPAIGDANGQDLLSGGAGNDFMNGNEGNDSLSGGEGNDTVRGGKDDDLLHGDSGDDIIYGDNGADHLCGGDGNDTLFGGIGSDAGIGAAGQEDTLCGGAGNDFLNGNEGSDKLDGGSGDDTLRGGNDNDTILGGEGSDVIWGDLGNDSLTGGNGSDIFVLSADGGSDIVADFSDGIDAIGLAEGLTFAQLTVSAGTNATLISLGSEVLATLSRVDVSVVGAADFVTV